MKKPIVWYDRIINQLDLNVEGSQINTVHLIIIEMKKVYVRIQKWP
jgi:hypothetical protein